MIWLIVRGMETIGWLIFLNHSQPPITNGIVLLWISSILGRNLLK